MYLSVNFISRKKNPNTRFTALHVDIMKINSVIRFFFQQYIYINIETSNILVETKTS